MGGGGCERDRRLDLDERAGRLLPDGGGRTGFGAGGSGAGADLAVFPVSGAGKASSSEDSD